MVKLQRLRSRRCGGLADGRNVRSLAPFTFALGSFAGMVALQPGTSRGPARQAEDAEAIKNALLASFPHIPPNVRVSIRKKP